MKVYPLAHLPSSHSPFLAHSSQLSAHLSQAVPLIMNPNSHLRQAVLLQDVHEAEHASQVLASFKNQPVAQFEQAESVQAVQLALQAEQVVVVTSPVGATDLKPLKQARQPAAFEHPLHPASHGVQAVPSR